MKLTIEKYHPHDFIKSIAAQIGEKSETDCLEEKLELSEEKGEGRIAGFLFSDGISILIFDCTLNKDWELNFINDSPAPMLFCFDIQGEIWHSFIEGDIRYQLNPLQGSITACPSGSTQHLTLPGGRKLRFAFLLMDRQKYFEKIECIIEQVPEKLADILKDTNAEKSFFYQGNYSMSSAECIKKIAEDKHTGLVRSTYLESKALELLSRQIKQYNDDLLSPGKQVMLRKYDVEKLKLARDILIEELQNPPTIENLAKKVGINQQKLKSGFKLIFDSTINQYVTSERMDQASLLLLKGASIKEAAATVGYSNQSHFANKFRDKYGILPKDYVKNILVKLNKEPREKKKMFRV